MKIETKAIHAGDRKADPAKPGAFIPVTTPIYTAASYIYEGRPFNLFAINVGYWLVGLAISGAVIAVWR